MLLAAVQKHAVAAAAVPTGDVGLQFGAAAQSPAPGDAEASSQAVLPDPDLASADATSQAVQQETGGALAAAAFAEPGDALEAFGVAAGPLHAVVADDLVDVVGSLCVGGEGQLVVAGLLVVVCRYLGAEPAEEEAEVVLVAQAQVAGVASGPAFR